MAAILIHIIWGIYLQIQNWLARPVGYVSGNKSETSFFSRFMIWTGALFFTFLILHFFNFYFIKLGLVKGILKIFILLHIIFSRSLHTIIYILPVSFCLDFTFTMHFLPHSRHSDLITGSGLLYVKVVALDLFNCNSGRFCFYFNHFMAFQIIRKKNINHGKIKFKDTRWSAGTKVDKI